MPLPPNQTNIQTPYPPMATCTPGPPYFHGSTPSIPFSANTQHSYTHNDQENPPTYYKQAVDTVASQQQFPSYSTYKS